VTSWYRATRLGETFGAQWRWEEARPRVMVGAALPAVIGIPGVLRIGENWDRFRFADPGGTAVEESRRARHVGFGGWVTAAVRPSLSLTYDRWSGGRDYAGVSANVAYVRDDRLRRLALRPRVSGTAGTPAGGQGSVGERSNHRDRPGRAGRSQLGSEARHGRVADRGTNLGGPFRCRRMHREGLLDRARDGRSHSGLAGTSRASFSLIVAPRFLDGAGQSPGRQQQSLAARRGRGLGSA
jgi:hypothetical protein